MRFVTLEEARATHGLRLVVTAGVPSPWSETAKGVFDTKGLDYLAVRLSARDADTRAWTGHQNAPVALFDDEPPRAGWAEILELAERIAPHPRLVPEALTERNELWRLGHDLLGPDGLVWCLRLVLIHDGLTSEGERGLPVRMARYLAPRYGYDPARIAAARERISSVLAALTHRLGGRRYFLGDTLSALDIFVATALGVAVPLPAAGCPTLPDVRHAYETLDPELRAGVTPALLAHRDFMYARHLTFPVQL